MMVRMVPESLDSSLSGAILFDWLQAPASARRAVLSAHAAALSEALVAEWMALAQSGPSYGGDRPAELAFQVALLELVLAAAAYLDRPAIAGEAGRLLAAHLAELPGRGEERIEVLEQAIAQLRSAGDWRGVWRAERDLGAVFESAHRPEAAIAAYDRAVKAAMALHEPEAEAATAIAALADLSLAAGRPEAALGTMHQWLDHCRDQRDRVAVGAASYALGAHLVAMGEFEEAMGPLKEALALFGEMGEDLATIKAHIQLMIATYTAGDAEKAGRHLDEVLRLRERIDDPEALAGLERQFGSFLPPAG